MGEFDGEFDGGSNGGINGGSDGGINSGVDSGTADEKSVAFQALPYEPLVRKIEARPATPGVDGSGGGGSGIAQPGEISPRPPTGLSDKPGSGRRLSAWRAAVIAAIVGAVAGAAVAGFVVLALEDDQASLTAGESITSLAVGNSSAQFTSSNSSDFAGSGFINVKDIYGEVKQSVVRISVALESGRPGSTGSGFVVSEDGYIATNAHVVALTASGNPEDFDPDAVEVTVHLSEGAALEATVIGVDLGRDLAVLQIDADNLKPVKLGTTGAVVVGDQVVAVGNALGLGDAPTVTTGIVSATNRAIELTNTRLSGLIQTDAAINPGNSGGPLLNANGEVIGINTAIAGSNTNGLGFAISVDGAMQVIMSLQEGVVIETAYLGVSIFSRETWETWLATADSDEYEDLQVADDVEGAIVVVVQEGSAADQGGIKAGDIVVEFAGLPISENQELQDAVKSLLPGSTTEVEVVRVSETGSVVRHRLRVKLGDIRNTTN